MPQYNLDADTAFWIRLADAIFDGYPYYHQNNMLGNTCPCCAVFVGLGLVVEEKILQGIANAITAQNK